MPYAAERMLIDKFGYKLVKRVLHESILFMKSKPIVSDEPKVVDIINQMIAINDFKKDLSISQMAELTRRCDNIVDFFPDPYNAVHMVRTRLHNMGQTLHTFAEREFVEEFIEQNFPVNSQRRKL